MLYKKNNALTTNITDVNLKGLANSNTGVKRLCNSTKSNLRAA